MSTKEIQEILKNPPWNRKLRTEYYRLRKKIHRLLSDTKTYKQNFKLKGRV